MDYFPRKSLSKYLMDMIDFNKHDIDIFINLAKIVRYGRHWYESCNEWRLLLIIYFDDNFPNAKFRPYDDYKNMSTLNTYCGILRGTTKLRKENETKRNEIQRNETKNEETKWSWQTYNRSSARGIIPL